MNKCVTWKKSAFWRPYLLGQTWEASPPRDILKILFVIDHFFCSGMLPLWVFSLCSFLLITFPISFFALWHLYAICALCAMGTKKCIIFYWKIPQKETENAVKIKPSSSTGIFKLSSNLWQHPLLPSSFSLHLTEPENSGDSSHPTPHHIHPFFSTSAIIVVPGKRREGFFPLQRLY